MNTRPILILTAVCCAPIAMSCASDSNAVDAPTAGIETTAVPTSPSTEPVESTTTTTAVATTAPPDTTAAPTSSTEPPPVTTAEPSLLLLRQGDEGPAVGRFQFKLVVLGYLPDDSDDGVFDAQTHSAVLEFQGDYGLVVDGIVGPQTDRAISAAAESINPEA